MAARLSLRVFCIGAIALNRKAEAPEVTERRKPSVCGLLSRAVNGFEPTCAKQDSGEKSTTGRKWFSS